MENETNKVRPVELPKDYKSQVQEKNRGFAEDYVAMEGKPSLFSVIEMLLKHPARVTYEVVKGDSFSVCLVLFVLLCLCLLAYGLIMGLFSGGMQMFVVPVKAVAGMLLSAALCLPSFYIFTSLQGGRQSVWQASGLMLMMLTLVSILMLGFAPVVWLFSQSTNAVFFMGLLHVVFFVASAWLGLQLLQKAMKFLNQRELGIVKIWGYLFILVVFQMCTVLRPMVGDYEKPQFAEKKLFIAHWASSLNERY